LILDEVSRALVRAKRKKTLKEAKAHEVRMRDALPGALISTRDVQAQFEAVVDAVHSAKDQHVAACAHWLVHANAYPTAPAVVLASRNTADFDAARLRSLGIEFQHPDEFLSSLWARSPQRFAAAFRRFRGDLRSKPEPARLLSARREDGQVATAAALLGPSAAGLAKL